MTSDKSKELGAFVKKHREAQGLSLNALARVSKLDPAYLHRLEQGRYELPGPDKLIRLARALEVAAEDLYAMAGYVMPEGLPNLAPYLRVKQGLSKKDAAAVEQFVRDLKEGVQETKKPVTGTKQTTKKQMQTKNDPKRGSRGKRRG